jgi:hypothetical protein
MLDRVFLKPIPIATMLTSPPPMLFFSPLLSSPASKSKAISHTQPHAALMTSPSIYRGKGLENFHSSLLLRVLVWRRDEEDRWLRCSGTRIADMVLEIKQTLTRQEISAACMTSSLFVSILTTWSIFLGV